MNLSCSSFVTAGTLGPDYPVYYIAHPLFQATIARRGAQVLEWTPRGQEPVLYRSSRANFATGKAVRGGIPVCWPWFAKHPLESSLPSHGLVRTRDWSLDSIKECPEEVSLLFSFASDPTTLAKWPFPFRLEAEVIMGAELSVQLTITNPGPAPFTMGGALHSYFSVSDLAAARISGLEDIPHFDKTSAKLEPATGSPLSLAGQEVDRIYATTRPVQINDPGRCRRILITSRGNTATVVWNPGELTPEQIPDIGPGEPSCFVAVEAAIPPGKEVEVGAGSSYLLATRISLPDPA